MTASVPEVDIKSILKKRTDRRAEEQKVALQAAQDRVEVAVPDAHLALHDYFQHLVDQNPDSELDGLTAMSDGAERFVELIQVGIERAASLPGSGRGAPQLGTAPAVLELESQVRQLEAENGDLLAEVRDHAAKEEATETLRRDASKQKRHIAELEGQLSAKTAEVQRLETAATTADNSQELTNAKTQISDLKSQLDVMQASHDQILREKDAEIAENCEKVKTAFIGKWVKYFLDLEERHIADPKKRTFTTAYRVTNPAAEQDSSQSAGTESTDSPTTDTATQEKGSGSSTPSPTSRRNPVQWLADQLPGHKSADPTEIKKGDK